MARKDYAEKAQLFVRDATGLVRSWSVFDAFIYAFFSINLVTLGMYIFASGPFIPRGNLMPAVIISGAFLVFECILYSQMISIMPRAGGDYVWQSRILGGAVGYILSITGWVFILWHWIPIYGTILAYEFVVPMLVILGKALASAGLVRLAFWCTTGPGIFVMSIITAGIAALYVSLGMGWYARMQKLMWFIAMAGLVLLLIVLLVSTPQVFTRHFDRFMTSIVSVHSQYAQIMANAAKAGYHPVALTSWQLGPALLLIPMVLFFNLWPNWGSTLYGEVRGASEYRRNAAGMIWALGVTTILAIIFFLVVAKGIGWATYQRLNWAFYSDPKGMPLFPYPGLLAALATTSPILQVLLILLMGAWFFGWCGTVFLSSTRVIFAAAFDRMAPERLADVTGRRRVPIWAVVAMVVPSIIVSALYAFVPGFSSYTLDATVVIGVMYLGTAVAGMILPYTHPDLYRASPVSRYQIGGVPLVTIAGIGFALILGFALYEWVTNAVYGVNALGSAIYMAVLYLIAAAIYVVYRTLRKRQGINVEQIYGNIPAE
ncbi:MAG: APC family permease [Firmicutes bacterium]|nr:APC family permease [Bacillota bacterium]